MSPLSDKRLVSGLRAAGKRFAHPPTSSDKLLPLLDRVEELLSKVEQSPPNSMHPVLKPLMKGLTGEELLKHSDIDVKVGVASCISEIIRITAPDVPYDDNKMKDVFHLIVSSFEDWSEVSSRSQEKRVTILETVAKVRSCVIMLDLECDQMIIDMLQHFLKFIRAYHPGSIFRSMETIMTLVIDESEDISTDLLSPLLSTLRRNNEDATPTARTLAESVIRNSADKLRPYIKQAVTSLKTSLDDYSEVLASVCGENTDTDGHNIESILKNQPEAEDDGEGTDLQDKDASTIISPNSVVSNGVNGTGTNEFTTEASTLKMTDSNNDPDSNFKAEQAQQEAENHDTPNKEEHISPTEVKHVEADETLENEEDKNVETATEASKPAEALTEASPVQSGSHPVESLSETEIKEKIEEKLVDDEMVSVDTAPNKASEEESISEANMRQHLGKKQTDDSAGKDKTLTEEVASKNDDASDSEAKSPDHLAEKLKDASNETEYESSVWKKGIKKRRRRKANYEKDSPKSAREDREKGTVTPSQLKSTKHEGVQEQTPRTSTKRKRTPGKEKASETPEFGKNLVGSKIKVWWPKDRMFYEGVIDSFDSVKKKHKMARVMFTARKRLTPRASPHMIISAFRRYKRVNEDSLGEFLSHYHRYWTDAHGCGVSDYEGIRRLLDLLPVEWRGWAREKSFDFIFEDCDTFLLEGDLPGFLGFLQYHYIVVGSPRFGPYLPYPQYRTRDPANVDPPPRMRYAVALPMHVGHPCLHDSEAGPFRSLPLAEDLPLKKHACTHGGASNVMKVIISISSDEDTDSGEDTEEFDHSEDLEDDTIPVETTLSSP